MARLDWEQANRQRRASTPVPDRRAEKRELALIEFTWKHKVSCFACGKNEGPWAKSGFSKRGPWIICAGCVTKRQAEGA